MNSQYSKRDHSGDMMCFCVCVCNFCPVTIMHEPQKLDIKLSSGMVCNCKCLYKFVEIEFVF